MVYVKITKAFYVRSLLLFLHRQCRKSGLSDRRDHSCAHYSLLTVYAHVYIHF